MPFIPHTDAETHAMLDTIGVDTIDQLFDEIPPALRTQGSLDALPSGMTEMALSRLMRALGEKDRAGLCFIGAGAYEHHIPAAVWQIAGRGEFLTCYTPYQAEASQGSLQLIYEYQSMMAHLMGMEVSNASLYEGASALAEAILMAVRLQKKTKSRRILIAGTLNPAYQRVVKTIVSYQDIELMPLAEHNDDEAFAALVIPQPNFFGQLEAVDELTDWAHKKGALVIGTVNPIAMALLKPPGQWGEHGADIACGEGQPLGIPLASGGPYFGFFCCKKAHVRQAPGRIVGRTTDVDGKTGYALTLQAREQHIRRSKATSNICTNQGLLVTAATIYMSLLGEEGLQRVARQSLANAHKLMKALCTLPGVEPVFTGPFFHEFVLKFNQPVDALLTQLADQGIQGGYALEKAFPTMKNTLLICATETKTDEDIAQYKAALETVLTR